MVIRSRTRIVAVTITGSTQWVPLMIVTDKCCFGVARRIVAGVESAGDKEKEYERSHRMVN